MLTEPELLHTSVPIETEHPFYWHSRVLARKLARSDQVPYVILYDSWFKVCIADTESHGWWHKSKEMKLLATCYPDGSVVDVGPS